MKKTLRSVMMAGAAVVALGASGQTLETVWSYTENIPGTAGGGNCRYFSAAGEKLIVSEKGERQLLYWDATTNGEVLYDLNEWLGANLDTEKEITDSLGNVTGTEVVKAAMGTAVATDDAGNILFTVDWPNAGCGKNFVIIPADGSEWRSLILDWTAIGLETARVDQIGRIVGNVLSEEGGYMWLCANGHTSTGIFKIVNGEQDEAYTAASSAVGYAHSTSAIAQPIYSTVAEIDELMDNEGDNSASFALRNRGKNTVIYLWKTNAEGVWVNEAVSVTETSEKGYTTAGASTEGFETFALQGVRYYVVPLSTDGTTNGRGTVFGIYREDTDENGKLVLKLVTCYDEYIKTGLGQAFGGFHVEANDENSVYIYRWIGGTQAAKFKFSVTAETPADPLYIFGSFNDWNPAASTAMTYANGVYTVEDMVLDAGSNFAFSTVQSSDWGTVNANRYGFENDNALAVLGGTPNAIVKGQGAMQVALAGVYDITVDLNAMTMTLTGEIAYPEHVYVLGNLSTGSWDTANGVELTQDATTPGVYTGIINVTDAGEGNGYFTFVTALGANWDAVNASVRFGATEKDEAIAEGDTKALKSVGGGSENSWKIAAGEWDVKVDLNAFTVSVSKATGVEGVAVSAEEVPAVYYNLQGVQVANPENGLYIVKRGNKVSKELIVK